MAGSALHPDVHSMQRIISLFMVKGFLSQDYNDRIPPQMVIVTVSALPASQRAAMESLSCHNVAIHIFMTVKTQAVLALLAERLVTPLALALVLCMALNEFAGHYQ